jgi:hypothetical protein
MNNLLTDYFKGILLLIVGGIITLATIIFNKEYDKIRENKNKIMFWIKLIIFFNLPIIIIFFIIPFLLKFDFDIQVKL